jgi:glycosyltransferase involved in cell wall biosynthesis
MEGMPQTRVEHSELSRFLCKKAFYYKKPLKRPAENKAYSLQQISGSNKNTFQYDFFRRTDISLKKWFSNCIEEICPDVVFFTYPSFGALLPPDIKLRTVIELFDTDVLNWDMQKRITKQLLKPNGTLADCDARNPVLDRVFLERENCCLSSEEFSYIRNFSAGIALTSADEKLLLQAGLNPVSLMPIMMDTKSQIPDYDQGFPFIMLGPNYFNLQGILHLDRRIIPLLLKQCPSIFIRLFGSVPSSNEIELNPCIVNNGFAQDISAELSRSSFFVNPVFSGTGMQIKTIEAMAHGLAVICYPEVAQSAGIIHGENGYVAKNEEDFANGITLLFKDRNIARKLGEEALCHIKKNQSTFVFDAKMRDFMSVLFDR